MAFMKKVRNPVTALTMRAALIWFACSIVGPLLTFVDVPEMVQIGKGLMLMSLGYLLFGLGLDGPSRAGALATSQQGVTGEVEAAKAAQAQVTE
ncbi:hypothetical protein [Pseudomonas cedrina]|uniref:hypothetical protein n=1 Tax=Pseudomonas cedrina TaxID=651740 RepID=UPI0027816602|nr:hypothetical protein [Pseudomonas cedrina]MDQ0655141.1 hypothetical protein [Pseudomonas cedrina]